jgi:integrase/recombinase XerD
MFFTQCVTNAHTHAAYRQAFNAFDAWAQEQRQTLSSLDPAKISVYVAGVGRDGSPATANLHLSAIRKVFDWFVQDGCLRFNPAASVPRIASALRPDRPSRKVRPSVVGKLLATCPHSSVQGLRDRALIAVLVYACAEVSTALSLQRDDYFHDALGPQLRLSGRAHGMKTLPAHPIAARCLDQYLKASGLAAVRSGPIFRALNRRRGDVGPSPLSRVDALRIVKQCSVRAKLRTPVSCRDLRYIGIRSFLSNGGNSVVARGYFGVSSIHSFPVEETHLEASEIARIAI